MKCFRGTQESTVKTYLRDKDSPCIILVNWLFQPVKSKENKNFGKLKN